MSIPILLGHNDSLLRLERDDDHLPFLIGGGGDVDLPRARAGGVRGGFFACWVPRSLHEPDPDEETTYFDEGYETSLAAPLCPVHARNLTLSMMQRLYDIESDGDGSVALVRGANDLVDCLNNDIFAMILHFEGAEAIDPDLSNLQMFYEAGLRSLGLVWSRPNFFGEGVQFCFPSTADTGPGLTQAGAELVRACNELGIMLDVSHLTEQGFWDLAKISNKPIVATHSNALALCPSSRNLSDDQLTAIAESGGLVGLNFCVSDFHPDGEEDSEVPLEFLYRQAEYLADHMGIDHLAIGSDFDGALMPEEMDEVSQLGTFMEGLAERGFSEEDLTKIGYKNWVRVLEETW